MNRRMKSGNQEEGWDEERERRERSRHEQKNEIGRFEQAPTDKG
jgi:hypothetical protein